MENSVGKKVWALAEGYIPEWSRGKEPEFESYGTVCILNVNDSDAHLEIRIFFEDTEAVGPYKIIVPVRRTKHIRFNNLQDPVSVPKGKDFEALFCRIRR